MYIHFCVYFILPFFYSFSFTLPRALRIVLVFVLLKSQLRRLNCMLPLLLALVAVPVDVLFCRYIGNTLRLKYITDVNEKSVLRNA